MDKNLTKIVRSKPPCAEAELQGLSEHTDPNDSRLYFYETDGDLHLLARPGSHFRFVGLRDPLSRPKSDNPNGHCRHEWSDSIRSAVEHAVDQSHEVHRVGSVHLRKRRWPWSQEG